MRIFDLVGVLAVLNFIRCRSEVDSSEALDHAVLTGFFGLVIGYHFNASGHLVSRIWISAIIWFCGCQWERSKRAEVYGNFFRILEDHFDSRAALHGSCDSRLRCHTYK